MFKNLKKKLEQGVAQTPLRAAVSALSKSDQNASSTEDVSSVGKPLAESTPQKSGETAAGGDANQSFVGNSVGTARTANSSAKIPEVPIGQLVDIPLEGAGESLYETASETGSIVGIGEDTPRGPRSRTSSISSVTSDSSFFPNISFGSHYVVPSDVESEMDESSTDLRGVSKEDLYTYVKKFERRAYKYKSKFMELVTHYKEMLGEREKLKTTLTQSQDRAFRRMSELREQIQLDQLAKRDLEDNYRLLLEERDEYIKVMQMQVKLLKEGKDVPSELDDRIQASKAKAETAPPEAAPQPPPAAASNQTELLKAKVKRQEELLQKCKESLRNYKDKVVQLATEKKDLLAKLEEKGDDNTGANAAQPDIARLQAQVKEARRVIQQLETDREMAIAQVKQQVHEEMEVKDEQLSQARGRADTLTQENAELQDKLDKMQEEIENLKKTNQEQLEKAREIIKRLKEDKKKTMEDMEVRLARAEETMEEEKEKLVQELSRGKAAAVSLLQEQSEKQLEEKLKAALEERDIMWQEKMAEQERTHAEMLDNKEKEQELHLRTSQEELQRKLKEKEEEVRLAIEERELQKMAAVSGLDQQKDSLLQQIEVLNSEKIELTNQLSKVQEDAAASESALQQQLEKMKKSHDSSIEDLAARHTAELQQQSQESEHSFQERMDSLVQNHAAQMQQVQMQHEEMMQKSSADLESHYKASADSAKSSLEQLLSEKKLQVGQLETTVADLRSQVSQIGESLSAREQELVEKEREYQAGIAELQAACEGQAESNKKLQKEMENLQTEFVSTRDRLEEQVTQFVAQVENLQTSLSAVGQENQQLKEQLGVLEEENLRLKDQLSSSQGEMGSKLQETESQRADLARQLNTLQTQKEEISNQLNVKQDELITCQQEVCALTEDKNKAEQELQTREETIILLRQQLASLTEEKAKVEEEWQQKESSREQSLSELEETRTSKITELEQRVQTLQASLQSSSEQLQETRSILENLQEEKSLLEAQVSDKDAQLQQVQRDAESARQEKEALLAEKTDFDAALSEKEHRIQQLQDGVSRLQACQHAVESEKAGLETKLGELETIVVQLQDAKQELSQKLEDSHTLLTTKATAQKEAMDSHVQELAQKIADLEKATASKADEILALRTVIDDNSAFIKELETRRDEQEKVLLAKTAAWEEAETKLVQNQEKFNQLRTEAKTKIKELKDTNDQLVKKHGEELAAREKEEEEVTKEKEALKTRVLALQKEQAELETTFKQHFEEKQAKYKETLNKLKERFEEKLREKKHEFEAQIEELTAQKESGAEDLTRSLEQLRQTQLQEQQETHARVLQETVSEWEAKLKTAESQFKHQLAEKDYALQERDAALEEKEAALQEKVAVLEEKELFLQEKLSAFGENESLLQEKESAIQERESALQECRHQCTQLQMEHSSMEEMLKALNDASSSKDEQIQTLTNQLSDASQTQGKQVAELTATLDEKNKLLESAQNEVDSVKSKYDSEITEMQERHAQQLREAENQSESKLAEMESNDRELQLHLKELNEKLTATEERLQDCIHNYESQIEEYRHKVEQLESSGKEQVSLLQQQLKDSQARSEASSTELQTLLQKKVSEGEEKLLQQMQDHQVALAAQTQEAQEKVKELKQKYVAKLREMQAQGEQALTQVREQLQHEKEEKEAVSSELSRANTRLLQMEESSGLSHNTIVDLERTVRQLESEISSKVSELEKQHQVLAESESIISKLKEETAACSRKLSDLEVERESVVSEKDGVIESQQQALTQVEARIAQQQAESDQWQKKAMELEEQLSDCRQSLTQAQAMHQKEAEQLNHKLDSLEVEKKELAVTVQSLQASHKELEVRLQSRDEELTSLKHSADRQVDVETRLAETMSERDALKQDYESQLQELQAQHIAQLEELKNKFENENTNKVSEYKKRAEAYISQVKKQLTSEKETALSELQSTIKTLEEEIAALKMQLADVQAEKEKVTNDLEGSIQEQSSKHNLEQVKNQTVIEDQNIQISSLERNISELKLQLETLVQEQSSLQEKQREFELSHQVSAGESQRLLEEVRAERDALQREFENMKCEKDGELDSVEQARDKALEKLRKDYEDRLRDQEEDHAGKIKQLAKDLNRQLMEKEREFEETLTEAIEKSQRGETDLLQEHQAEIKELRQEMKERDKLLEQLQQEYQVKMEEQGKMLTERITSLQEELSTAKQHHQVQLWEMEQHLKASSQRVLHTRSAAHKEEVTALMQEWNKERKFGVPAPESVAPTAGVSEEIVQQNQAALMAVQSGSGGGDLLRQQVIALTKQLEDLRERHKLEVAELQSQLDLSRDTVQPLVVSTPVAKPRTFDPDDPNLAEELQNLELHNMDLQAQLRHVNAELAHSKLREKDSQQRMEVLEHRLRHRKEDDTPPLSPDGSLLSYHEDSALLREPTEFEYLKNILYEYMMGRETKTLAKVIATVVRFSEEQTRQVVDRAASRTVRFKRFTWKT